MVNRLLVFIAALMFFSEVFGQDIPGQYVWEEFGKRIKASESVSALGPNFAGDQISMSNGALSFEETDVNLPGNSGLPVSFGRRYSVFNRKDYSDLGMLGDWEADVPSISGVFAATWLVGLNNSSARCTSDLPPRASYPFRTGDFFHGLRLRIPGVADAEVLRRDAKTPSPENGSNHLWMTNGQIHLSCLSKIRNGEGEGFLAITPNGTKYWFDWMGQTLEPLTVTHQFGTAGERQVYYLPRKRNFLYATRIEDRFGNAITYEYSNAWNETGRLNSIEADDGRRLSFSYHPNTARIASVSDGTRTWQYSYANTAKGRATLSAVSVPGDGSWTIQLSALTDAEIKYLSVYPPGEIIRSCTLLEYPQNGTSTFSGSITHPAGGKATFVVGIRQHGRSFVPVSCLNVKTTIPDGENKGADNDPNDDINMWPTSSYSLTLLRKEVSGPGLEVGSWTYSYSPNVSLHWPEGTTMLWPVCNWQLTDCAAPPCTSESCAKFSTTTVTAPNGQWTRYHFGNTYSYNEGKLLRVSTGEMDSSRTIRTVSHFYDYDLNDKAYPARFGFSLNPDAFAENYPRPLQRSEIVQQGIVFRRNVDEFDEMARPVKVTSSSTSAFDSDAPNIDPPVMTVPATVVSGESFKVSWTSELGATQYRLYRSVGGGAYALVLTTASTTATLNYSGSPVTLYYKVRACDRFNDCGDTSAAASVKVIAAPPPRFDAPSLSLPDVALAGREFTVSWTSQAGATRYELERWLVSEYEVRYSGSALQKKEVYYSSGFLKYRVRACDTVGCGAYSAESTVQIKVSGPIEP